MENKNPKFAVVLTELIKPNSCTVKNEYGETFPHYHAFKIGDVVELCSGYDGQEFKGPNFSQHLREQDFFLLK